MSSALSVIALLLILLIVARKIVRPIKSVARVIIDIKAGKTTSRIEHAGNQKNDIARITEATEKMQWLLNDLLELSRIGRLMHPPEDIPFEDIVREALEMVSGRLNAGNVQVKIVADGQLLYGERQRFREVFENLLDNAVKCMGAQPVPKIAIGTRPSEGEIVYYVQDNGIGLAVAYSIVDKHDGHITAESEDGGTTFYVYLPATEAAVSGQTDRQGALLQGVEKVLLMDDGQGVRTVGREMLKALGYKVVCACDGAQAVEVYGQAQAAGEAFDAVILDLTIPGGMGGKNAVTKILTIDASAAVIVLSGYSNDQVIAQFRQYGFRGAVCKLYQLQDLGAVLHEVLAGKSSG